MRLHNRMVKANFWTDTDLIKNLSRDGRMFYQGLWQLADDSGCIEDDVLAFKIHLFPADADITIDDLSGFRDKLVEMNKLTPYITDGKRCLFLNNFNKHQSIKNPAPPSVPLPEWLKWEPYPSNPRSGKYQIISKTEEKSNDLQSSYEGLTGDLQSSSNQNLNQNLNHNHNQNSTCPNSESPDDVSPPQPVENTCSYVDNSNKMSELPEEAFKAAEHLKERILANNPRARVPKTLKELHKWAAELDKLNRIGPPGGAPDGSQAYTWAEIWRLIDWCQDDPFWQGNILSAATFRKQIVKLENQSKRARGDPQKDNIKRLYEKYSAEEAQGL